MTMKVLVAGGGIGGLALAQGLRRAGIQVDVYEGDPHAADRLQGYRIHINRAGSRALYDLLPPPLFEAFVATSGQPNTGIGFFDHRLRELVWFGDDAAPWAASRGTPPADSPEVIDACKSVSRITLRQILLTGLDGTVHFGKTLDSFSVDASAAVTWSGPGPIWNRPARPASPGDGPPSSRSPRAGWPTWPGPTAMSTARVTC